MSDRHCRSTYNGLICNKRPHIAGWHVAIDPDANRIVYWSDPINRHPDTPRSVDKGEGTPGYDLADDKPSPTSKVAPPAPTPVPKPPAPIAKVPPVIHPTYTTSEMCTTCGSLNMVSTGTCSTCQDCGTSSGCG